MLKKIVVLLALIVVGFVSYQLLNEEKVINNVDIQIKKNKNVDHNMRVIEKRIPTEEELRKIREDRDRILKEMSLFKENKKSNTPIDIINVENTKEEKFKIYEEKQEEDISYSLERIMETFI
jgi:hypothetical protein